ncbi:MAG: sensor histidine kinase [Actinomycetota bacterium]
MLRLSAAGSRRGTWIRLSAALLLSVAATLVAGATGTESTTNAALLYLVAVVGAALFGGVRAGLVASVLSFLGLNFFFTPPFRTLAVERVDDVVALFVFLLVSSLVATLLSRALNEQARAEARERENFLLYQLSSNLLGREALEDVLSEVSRDLVDLFGAPVEIRIRAPEGEMKLVASESKRDRADGPSDPFEIPLRTERGDVGLLRLLLPAGKQLDQAQRELAEACATQIALALEAARLDRETREARAEAEASRIRAALFSSVTHDLRTPLSSIRACATSLLEEGVEFAPAQREDLLRTIVEETDRLNRLIGNILQLSRLRAGALVPRKIVTPVEDVIQPVVARLGRLLDGRTLRVRVREGIPPVPVDVVQLDQALSNVLENSARYAPPGSEVEIQARRWQESVEILVSDQGPGIAAEDRERVFQEFYRGGGADAGGSSGLGLAIARAIAVAHGGSAWVQETPGGGATIGLRLPLSTAAAPSP